MISSQSIAHEAQPLLIGLTQSAQNQFLVRLNIPKTVQPNNLPTVSVTHCVPNKFTATQYQQDYVLKCERGISQVSIHYSGSAPDIATAFLLQLSLRQASELDETQEHFYQYLAAPGELVWQLPKQQSEAQQTLGTKLQTATQYSHLGVVHILKGLDHLLFVSCLLLLMATRKKLMLAITGFTLAHSLSLALATLGWVKLHVGAVEALIALSVVYLAAEILHSNPRSYSRRYPLMMSSVFGLLHGLGFAAVLSDLGFPQGSLITALLSFNVGVELGQLLFIGIVLSFFYILVNIWSKLSLGLFKAAAAPQSQLLQCIAGEKMAKTPWVYLWALGIGSIAMVWFIERLLAMFHNIGMFV